MDRQTLRAVIETAAGRRPADLLLRRARVVNVFTGRIEDRDVAIAAGYVAGFAATAAARAMDLQGAYLLPGFIDAHVHLESGLLEPGAWAREVLALGTTAVVADPHEIANVLGLEGIRFLSRRLAQTPLRACLMAPSCVPATHLETTGARLDAEAVSALLRLPEVTGLGEVMNAPGLLAADDAVLSKVVAALETGCPVDGHAPGLRGASLDAYAAAGVQTDHECISPDEAREKLARGLHILLREGSAARNLEALLPVVTPDTLPRCMFCTDDRQPADLRQRGHVNSILARAVELGLDPVSAIRLATLNPARHYGLARSGAVAPGYRADMVVCPDLKTFRPSHVLVGGQCLVEEGECRWRPPAWEAPWPNAFRLPALGSEAFRLRADSSALPVIGVVPGQILTEALTVERDGATGEVCADSARDLLKLFVIERYTGNAGRAGALVQGFSLQAGALAASVAHDAHNVIVVGADDESMARAVNCLREHGGGLATVGPGVEQVLPLPVAGLMSPADVATVLATLERLLAAGRSLGCRLEEPFMQLAFLALPVIPALKLTDRGLVDVRRFEFVQAYRGGG
jgi:adenine deaminase